MTEAARLAALHEYELLDAPVDQELSALVQAAAVVAGVPTATLNLITGKQQCQLTTMGFPKNDAPRDDSMCAVVFQDGRSTQVPDARLDARFVANPWVTGRLGHIRFYASVPLITEAGHSLGTLCVFDEQPGRLDETQMAALEGLAGVVMALFERRRETRRNAGLAAEAQRQRELAEEYLRQLQERQELMTAVQDTIDVAIAACDAQGTLTLFNRAARQWHGVGAGELSEAADRLERCTIFAADGVTVLEVDDLPLHRALHDKKVQQTEIVIAPARGQPVRALCSGRALNHPDGTPLGAVITMTDITAHRRFQREISEREHLLSTVYDTAPDAFIITDSTGVVTAWNPAAEKMFGWSATEACGVLLETLIIPPQYADAHAQGLARRAATGETRLPHVVQVPAVRRDGSELLIELSLASFTWHGQRRFHAFLRDVTDRERAREHLAQANKALAEANDELDRFTATVAHDLKAPLTAIAGYAELLQDDAAADGNRHNDVALAAITRATARMGVMIDDLLDYARAADEPLVRELIHLDTVVEEVAADIRAATTQRVSIAHEAMPTVHAHPTLLRQVLANVLGNAVKYVSPGTDPQLHVSAHTDGSTVTIEVTDNGIGIAPDAWDRIFTMFRREHTQGYQGNGIGLATCRRIMQRHHGRIWIGSSSDAGTTVKISFPAAPAHAAEPTQ